MIETFTINRREVPMEVKGKTVVVFAVEATVTISDTAGVFIKRTKTVKAKAIEAALAMQLAMLEMEAWTNENKAEVKAIENQYAGVRPDDSVSAGNAYRQISSVNAIANVEPKGAECTCDGGNKVVSTRQGKATLTTPLGHASWCQAKA